MPSSQFDGGPLSSAAGPDGPLSGSLDAGPSVLDLVRLSPEKVLPLGGEGIYRQIALLTEIGADQVVMEAACGRGLGIAFLAETTGAECYGLDPNPLLMEDAERRLRAAGKTDRLHFEIGSLEDLPYRDGIFDVSIGGVGLAALADPGAAVRELARVTKPMGSVVLMQLIWTGNVEAERRKELIAHLGARPLLLVEWKQLLRDAGVVELHVEDWSDYASPFRPAVTGPFQERSEMLSLREKAEILHRAFRRWGWRGVRGAIMRDNEIHRLLTRERVLGLSLIRGTRWAPEE